MVYGQKSLDLSRVDYRHLIELTVLVLYGITKSTPIVWSSECVPLYLFNFTSLYIADSTSPHGVSKQTYPPVLPSVPDIPSS